METAAVLLLLIRKKTARNGELICHDFYRRYIVYQHVFSMQTSHLLY
jgi:hypothetical protein